jgi:hypothetical protein
MSHEKNAGQNHNINRDSKSFENVAKLKNSATTLSYQNCIHKEISRRWKPGNARYLSVQNFCLPPCYPKI